MTAVSPYSVPVLLFLTNACSLTSHYPSQAVACESWVDGSPTQVEEDLWDDSMLEVWYTVTTHYGCTIRTSLV